ncbi:oligosaccharide flippase family protein [Haladaptatus halobius]|uniref:oligosaccharide flippase family protein n=1 Tax=Haladaptatus halobius TaxID=2884875 RepID=UPI001D0A5F9A|nr:oligosaccharide flippase family protein [Haladaptatus halobius]
MSSVTDSLSALVRSATIVFIGSAFGRVIALIAEAFIARSLMPTTYGQVALAFSIVGAVGSVLLFGIHEGVTRLLSATTDKKKMNHVTQAGYLSVAISGIIGVLIVIIFSKAIAQTMSQPGLALFLVLLSPYLLLYPLSQVSISILRSWGQTKHAILSRAIASRIIGIFSLGILLHFGFDAEAAVIYWLIIPFTIISISTYFINPLISYNEILTKRPDANVVSKLWSFSWPLAIGSVIFLFLSKLDILMIGYFLSAKEVGYYRSIQPLRQASTFVLASFSFLFLPLATRYFEKGKVDDLGKLFTTTTKWTVIVALPMVLILMFFSDNIVLFLFGEAYRPAALPLSILSAGYFLRALSGLDGDMVKAINVPKIELFAGVMGVIVNFILNLLLIPIIGIAGAALGTVVGFVIYNTVELVAIYRITGQTPFSWNLFKPMVPTVVAAFVLSVFIQTNGFLILLPTGIVLGIVSFASVFLTRSLSDADQILITRFESKTGYKISNLVK